MSVMSRSLVHAALIIASLPALASGPNCGGAAKVEELRYSWRLRGGIRFVAGFLFPTRGEGNLRTVYPTGDGTSIHSELLITATGGKKGGYYAYESEMEATGARTLMTFHAYEWGKKSRSERTIFDYVKRLARIRRETPEEVRDRVKKLPDSEEELRDLLTAIHFLRRNAHAIDAPMQTTIYSDGKEYPVIFRPAGRRMFVIAGRTAAARGFEVVDAPGGRKWPGGVKVWLSDDERRVPFRIEIEQSLASLQLDLESVDGCRGVAGS